MMSKPEDEVPLPDKEKGVNKEFKACKKLATAREAQSLFEKAKKRLLDINSWDKICGKPSAIFQLTNAQGANVEGPPMIGYYVKIDIPGPGPDKGRGFDWVKIEAFEQERSLEEDSEFVLIRVRPSAPPVSSGQGVAHFFSDTATSSFMLKRIENVVTSGIFGRNEIPNATDDNNFFDKIRNAIVGVTAALGLSTPQWQRLADAWLETG